MRRRADRVEQQIRDDARRAATISSLAQAGAAAAIGAFFGSIADPAVSVRWILLGLAVLLAAVAAYYGRRASE